MENFKNTIAIFDYSVIRLMFMKLIKLFPNELNGLIENNNLVLNENQKEDFVKQLPLVAEYCR